MRFPCKKADGFTSIRGCASRWMPTKICWEWKTAQQFPNGKNVANETVGNRTNDAATPFTLCALRSERASTIAEYIVVLLLLLPLLLMIMVTKYFALETF